MRLHRCGFLLVVYSLFWLVSLSLGVEADSGVPALSLDLSAALERALKDNPELKAKRQTLGIAQGRVQQAELVFQNNPRLSVDADYRHRRFALPTGKSGTDTEVRLLQEIEIAGQRGYRREAAAKNLAQAEWSVTDAERLLRLEVTQVFYDLLAAQEKIVAQQQVLTIQEVLLQAGLGRFERGDISVLELDTLRLDRDRARNELINRENEKVLIEKRLRSLLGLGEEASLVTVGNLRDLTAEQAGRRVLVPLGELEACALLRQDKLGASYRVKVPVG